MPVRFLCRVVLFATYAASLSAAPIQWTTASGGNGHWYDYVPVATIFTSIGFDDARNAALASSHLGMQGYLATVTSAEEQQFINNFSFLVGFGASGTAFLGASDAVVEGQFRWLDGPESGHLVSYTNWAAGHPTGITDFLALYVNYVSPGSPVYGWSDSSAAALGYVVEYSAASDPGVPEPSSLPLALCGLAGLVVRRRG